MTPPANRLLPPASPSGAHSRTTTLAPCSRADRTAQSAALPAPTTTTSCSGLSIALEGGGHHRADRRAVGAGDRHGDRARVPPGDRRRVVARAPGHDDDDVRRLLRDPQRSPAALHLLDTAAAPHAQDGRVALADVLERNAGAREQRLTHPLLVEALARGERGVLWAEHEQRLLAHEHDVRAGNGHGPGDRLEHLVGGLALLDDIGGRGPSEGGD